MPQRISNAARVQVQGLIDRMCDILKVIPNSSTHPCRILRDLIVILDKRSCPYSNTRRTFCALQTSKLWQCRDCFGLQEVKAVLSVYSIKLIGPQYSLFDNVDMTGRPQTTRYLVFSFLDALIALQRKGDISQYKAESEPQSYAEAPLSASENGEGFHLRLLSARYGRERSPESSARLFHNQSHSSRIRRHAECQRASKVINS